MVKLVMHTPFFPPGVGWITNRVLHLNTNLVKQRNAVTFIVPKHPY